MYIIEKSTRLHYNEPEVHDSELLVIEKSIIDHVSSISWLARMDIEVVGNCYKKRFYVMFSAVKNRKSSMR